MVRDETRLVAKRCEMQQKPCWLEKEGVAWAYLPFLLFSCDAYACCRIDLKAVNFLNVAPLYQMSCAKMLARRGGPFHRSAQGRQSTQLSTLRPLTRNNQVAV
jgi:hypothetical protein